ncbi:hypothetical protein F4779DRAFT_129564 [Xylariaceae sp. FL0662B]|nr:hypothetical protein F4779DRAFT_129564 [Xylariaceae sp. FL0662B]
MEPLTVSESLSLDALPTDILFIIFSYLDTARSVAHLALTCKGLNRFVSHRGWRIFVTNCFSSLSLVEATSENDWRELARSLTSQSRDWDRRAFVVDSLVPPGTRRSNKSRPRPRLGELPQSIPGNTIVDAHLWRHGRIREELVIWGTGEDIVARVRQTQGAATKSETWHSHKGSQVGHRPGKDDTTSISILRDSTYSQEGSPEVLVGRTNGDLRLLSTNAPQFGRTLLHFRPSSTAEPAIDQREIQSFDTNYKNSLLAAGTKDSILFYALQRESLYETSNGLPEAEEAPCVEPTEIFRLRKAISSAQFEFIRSVKFMNRDTLAIGLNRGSNPLQYLRLTPTGIKASAVAKMAGDHISNGSHPRTVRALLPVDLSSIAHGGGNTLLSTWDDGTIRLQDLRTPSPHDRIYQDNFEISTPLNALLSYGLERFVAGSAYGHQLKIFDFRWPKGYYHTESLACGADRPYPPPKPPTTPAAAPFFPDDRPACDHPAGRPCRWHALARHDFYRPNCNVYLRPPGLRDHASPVYSLAKPSDDSPALFAGLSGALAQVTVKSSGLAAVAAVATGPSSCAWQNASMAVIETGDGAAVSDVAKCQGVPPIRLQAAHPRRPPGPDLEAPRRHRLDESLHLPQELPG